MAAKGGAAKGGKVGQTLIWIMLGMLIIGLAGFGITGFGGTVRSIGKVGGQDISTDQYYRDLQQEISSLAMRTGRPVDIQQASLLGIDRSVLHRLVTTAALDDELDRMGLSVGDARLAQEIRNMDAFTDITGQFDRETYRLTLQQSGFSEAQFEERIRADIARGLAETTLTGGLPPPDALAQAFYDYLAEERSFTLLRLTEADLPEPLPDPTEEVLRAHYEANPDIFTRPEARRIAYAALLPEDAVEDVPVEEEHLRALYNQRLADFVQPERRLVERLVFGTEEEALEARNRIDAGTDFADIVAGRGLDLADTDMGDVSAADLGAAADAVFAAAPPAVVGPLPSSLGPALFRVNGVLAAQEITFEEARDDLHAEFALDGARRMLAARSEEIDDLLAGGATLEDLEGEAGMRFDMIELRPGETPEGIAAYPAFRERAQAATDRDFPELFELDDGGIAALRLDAIVPPELPPYEAIASAVAEHWRIGALRAALAAHAETIEAALAGDAATDLGAYGIAEAISRAGRDGHIEGAPEALVATVFALDEGATAQVAAGDFVALVRLDSIHPADGDDPQAQFLKSAFAAQTAQEMGIDLFVLYARAVEESARITLNEAAINAVHAQMR
ncbi:MAG: SurA N-terminal domain-containing protein [Gemmobacter sp.]